jgi:LPS export ABC transporter protein LptC
MIIGFLSFGLLSCTELDENTDQAEVKKDYPDQESWDATMYFTKEGKRRAVLKAGYIAKFTSKKYTLIEEGLRVEFYDEDGNPKSVLTSNKGKVLDTSQDMIATGNVIVVAKNGSTLYTEELKWKNREEQIISDMPVKITTPTDTIYGDTFISDPDLVNYEITNTRGSSQKTISIDD